MSSPAYEVGSGGYIKRRLFRNSRRTPYERPPLASCNVRSTSTDKENDGRWLSAFMQPASRFITRTACKLVSSILPKWLSAQSGVEGKHLVHLDTPIVNLAEQKLIDCHNLITSNAGGISDIEQFINQRWFTRAEAEHLMASINSRSSEVLKSESENNKQVKVLKRDNPFLDDDNVLLGPLCKIPKKSIIEEDKIMVNVPFKVAIPGDQIARSKMNDAFTCSTTIASNMSFPPPKKSYFHMSAPEDVDLEGDVVENTPSTIAISGDAIRTIGMNETSTSSTSLMSIRRSSNTTISCLNALYSKRKSYFHMSAPEDFDDYDEEYDATKESSNTTISCLNALHSKRKSYFHMSAPEDFDDSDEEYDATKESDESLFNLGAGMNDGSTDTWGSNTEEDFTFPVIIDHNNYSTPPTPTMPRPSHVKLPFQKD